MTALSLFGVHVGLEGPQWSLGSFDLVEPRFGHVAWWLKGGVDLVLGALMHRL